jgi:peptidoglycan pentaglycine glycine transferase (the first glycine)
MAIIILKIWEKDLFNVRVIDIKEKERFNQFITAHPKGHFLQLWEWGQVKKNMGWVPLPLILEEGTSIKAALLVLKRALPVPGLTKCIFYAPRGPVVDIDDFQLCQALFAGVKKLAKQHGAVFIKIDPDVPNTNAGFRNLLAQLGFRKKETGLDFEGVQPNFVFRLDITPSEEDLLKNMHSKTRYNIRLAQRKGVKVRERQDKQALSVFYEILQETAQRDGFLIRGYEYFEGIWEYMVKSQYARLFLADYEERVISGALGMITGNKMWYLYGASSNTYRNLMPNHLLQWEMIKWARNHGCTLYDFRGVSGDIREDNPLYGLYRFKKGFNGDLIEFVGGWDMVYQPFYYYIWDKVLPIYQQAVRNRLKGKM